MSECGFPKERLQAWLDGEAGDGTAETQAHVEQCPSCASQVEAWRSSGEALRAMIDEGLGDVEPLAALEQIRDRISRAQSRSLVSRIRYWWEDTWLFNRRALAGVAVAAALGALVAPGLVYVATTTAPPLGLVADAPPDDSTTFASGQNGIAMPIELKAKLIYAHNESDEVDPRLEGAGYLSSLGFSAYRLEGEVPLPLDSKVQLPNGMWASATLRGLTPEGHLRLLVRIGDSQESTVVIVKRGTVPVRGPSAEDGVWILGVTWSE